MPPNIFPQQAYLTPALAMFGLLHQLVEVDGTFEIVEAYDADNAGTKRRTPTPGDTYNFDNVAFMAGTFGFRTGGTLGAGDWIVLRSTGAPKLQIYWSLFSTTVWRWALISNNDFVTGGGDASPPAFPATAIGTVLGAATLVDMALQLASMNYSMWSDDQTLAILALDGTVGNTRIMYIGAADSDVAGDTKPFVINDLPGTAGFASSARWNRLALDGATFLSVGIEIQPTQAGSVIFTTSGAGGLATPTPTQYHVFPAFIFFNDAGHRHILSLKWSYLAHSDLAASGTLASLAIVYFTNSLASARWAMTWDGVTAV